MEFLLLVALVILVIWFAASQVVGRSRTDPAKLGGDLAAALSQGDVARVRKLLGKLPGWRIVDCLTKVVDNTLALQRNSSAAAQAGVPAETIDSLLKVVSRTDEIVTSMARKVSALGLQSDGKFKRLPPDARTLLDADTRRLEDISRASRAVRDGLTVTTASIQGGDATSQADALEAFARALHELGSS
jgi:hypothetical protein